MRKRTLVISLAGLAAALVLVAAIWVSGGGRDAAPHRASPSSVASSLPAPALPPSVEGYQSDPAPAPATAGVDGTNPGASSPIAAATGYTRVRWTALPTLTSDDQRGMLARWATPDAAGKLLDALSYQGWTGSSTCHILGAARIDEAPHDSAAEWVAVNVRVTHTERSITTKADRTEQVHVARQSDGRWLVDQDMGIGDDAGGSDA